MRQMVSDMLGTFGVLMLPPTHAQPLAADTIYGQTPIGAFCRELAFCHFPAFCRRDPFSIGRLARLSFLP